MATVAQAVKPAAIPFYSLRSLSLIGVCFVLSGATGLIYEVLWARMLGLVFGATTLAVSTVLAAYSTFTSPETTSRMNSALSSDKQRKNRRP